jgi:hypothetical protein
MRHTDCGAYPFVSDGAMIQVMDNENRDTYASSPASMIESVRAVVTALAAGTIPAFEIDAKVRIDNIRYAPSFVPGKPCGTTSVPHPYTALSVSLFLGRARAKTGTQQEVASPAVMAALDALYLKERGRFNDSLLVTVSRRRLREQIKKLEKEVSGAGRYKYNLPTQSWKVHAVQLYKEYASPDWRRIPLTRFVQCSCGSSDALHCKVPRNERQDRFFGKCFVFLYIHSLNLF